MAKKEMKIKSMKKIDERIREIPRIISECFYIQYSCNKNYGMTRFAFTGVYSSRCGWVLNIFHEFLSIKIKKYGSENIIFVHLSGDFDLYV